MDQPTLNEGDQDLLMKSFKEDIGFNPYRADDLLQISNNQYVSNNTTNDQCGKTQISVQAQLEFDNLFKMKREYIFVFCKYSNTLIHLISRI